jgi:hypothetical protein
MAGFHQKIMNRSHNPAAPRKSSSTEEKARDILLDFLKCSDHRPLAVFLQLIFDGKTPKGFLDLSAIDVRSEYEAIGCSRVDLAFRCEKTILCLEIKVDAQEQLGQYVKYRDYFRHEGFDVHIAGLVNRFKRPGCKNDNDPFFKSLAIPRFLWSELLAVFQRRLGSTPIFQEFRQSLQQLDQNIGAYARDSSPASGAAADCSFLASDTGVLLRFYEELSLRFTGWEAVPSKYGNAPYSLYLGKPDWGPLFRESSCRRIALGFNNGRKCQIHSEPYFAPGIMLWDRTWFYNLDWFLNHRVPIANHFRTLGFEIIRNQSAHRNTPWTPPYKEINSLFFANAFWEKHFSLTRSEYCRIGWARSLDLLELEIRKLADMIDSLGPQLETNP